jgi:anti-anti-sigma factor
MSTFQSAVYGETAWVQIRGQLVVRNATDLGKLSGRLIQDGAKTIVLDFDECGYIDSTGLGRLVSIQRQTKKFGATLVIQNLNEDLDTLFRFTRFDDLFLLATRKEFEQKCAIVVPNFEQINREFVEYFARNPERLTDLDWRKFELLLEAILRNNGFRTELGSGHADRGIDLRLVQSDACGELITLVQAKKYDTHRPIRLEAVQAFCAVIDDEKANRGLFVTTSRYLPGARQFAERQRHRLTLADSIDVARWCEGAIKRMIKPH